MTIIKWIRMRSRLIVISMLLLPASNGCDGKAPATLTSITVTPECYILTGAMNKQFTATGLFSDNSEQDLTAQVTWSSSDATVAGVTSGGLATAAEPLGVGSAQIAAALSGVKGQAVLTVTDIASPQYITVTPTNQSIPYGTGVQFAALGTFQDGSTQDVTSLINWSSSDPTVKFSCASPGRARSMEKNEAVTTIAASLNSTMGTATVTIENVDLLLLQVNPSPSVIVLPSGKVQFTAIGTFSNNLQYDITRDVEWQSSDVKSVTIDSTGLARSTGMGVGATISATTMQPLTAAIAQSLFDIVIE